MSVLRDTQGYVSGQSLCTRFDVSRNAVWKQIRQLQEEGYEIEAVPNRGYRLVGYPDVITAEETGSRMQTEWVGREILYYPSVDSTNTVAKRMGEEGAAQGLLVIADEQTAGKGRRGRAWQTPAGTAIAMTVLLRPAILPERISMVTLVMGLAVTEAVRDLTGLDAGIKWPNDVVVKGKKLTGILTEMSAELQAVNYIVIGIGINVNVPSFPAELTDTATSLLLETGHKVNRAELIARTMLYFEQAYDKFIRTQDLSLLMDRYNTLLLSKDRPVRVLEPETSFTGTAVGIDPYGRLLVRDEDGEIREIYAGEVSVRGIYGYI